MTAPLRVAVIGVGHLGQHHARLLAAMPGVELVGVVDTKPGRAEEIAAKYGAPAFTDARDVARSRRCRVGRRPDGRRTSRWRGRFSSVASRCWSKSRWRRRCAEADELLTLCGGARCAAGRRAHRAVQSGGRRRAAARVAPALHRSASPRHVSGAQPRHRRDLRPDDSRPRPAARRGRLSEVESVEAVGVNVLTPRTDIANARLRFADGCIANVTASRISRDRVRKARFFQHDSYVSIDFAAQEVEVYRLAPAGRTAGDPGRAARHRLGGAAAARARRLRRRGATHGVGRRCRAGPAATRWRWRHGSPRRWRWRQRR